MKTETKDGLSIKPSKVYHHLVFDQKLGTQAYGNSYFLQRVSLLYSIQNEPRCKRACVLARNIAGIDYLWLPVSRKRFLYIIVFRKTN